MNKNNDISKGIGRVHIKVVDKYGNVKFDKDLGENIVTNAGKAALAGLTNGVGSVPTFTWLALGTSATAVAVTDTILGSEITTNGLGRTAAACTLITTTVTNDTAKLVVTWTASGSSTIQEIGIFNNASNGSGTLLAHKLTGAISVVNTDQLTATYTFQLT